MSDRLTTLAGALGALLLLVGLMYVPQPTPTVSRPTSQEGGENGYLALQTWLQRAGVETRSHRRRFDKLDADQGLPASGNVMLTTLPYAKPLREDEVQALHRWIEAGNTLLVLAGLDETVNWHEASLSAEFPDDLAALTGLEFDPLLDDEDEPVEVGDLFDGHQHTFSPQPLHPLMNDVAQLRGESDSMTFVWVPRLSETPFFVLRLGREDQYGIDAFWEMPRGDGHIILSASSTLFSNRMLGEADNAQFFRNILSWHLRPGGVVVFDDMHQGLSELYDPEAFFADPRLHKSIAFVLVFWLLYLLSGSSRLAPRIETSLSARQTDLVSAIGGFMERKLSRSDTGLAMINAWLDDSVHAGRPTTSAATPPWSALEALPGIDLRALHAVRDSYRKLGLGERVDLKILHNHLLTLKRNMA